MLTENSLQEEIEAFEQFMNLTPDEAKAAKDLADRVRNIASQWGFSSTIIGHGSRSTGLASPDSDVDLSIVLPDDKQGLFGGEQEPLRMKKRQQMWRILRKFQSHLKKDTRFSHIELRSGRIPILEARDSHTWLQVQLQTMAPIFPSLKYAKQYLSQYPTLRPLYVLLRASLQLRDLKSVFDGGVGSYALLIMIVTAFKHSPKVSLSTNHAYQLLHILDFWAKADLTRYGYAPDPPLVFPKVALPNHEEMAHSEDIEKIRVKNKDFPFLLCLQDPGNLVNDLGKSSYLIKDIQVLFQKARDRILSGIDYWDSLDREGREKWDGSLLNPLVTGNWTSFIRGRRHVRQGAKTPTETSNISYSENLHESPLLCKQDVSSTDDEVLDGPTIRNHQSSRENCLGSEEYMEKVRGNRRPIERFLQYSKLVDGAAPTTGGAIKYNPSIRQGPR